MWRLILGLFLIAHSLIHAAEWLAPLPQDDGDVPFDPKRSWLMSGLCGDGRGGGDPARSALGQIGPLTG